MRFRKLASTTAGALVLGALSVPMMATSAQAAPVSATTPFSATCTYGNFNMPVSGTLAVQTDGTAVTAKIDATATIGSPAVTTNNLGMQMVLDIDGAPATVSGSKAYSPANPGMTAMPIPEMKGTRASSAYPAKFDVTSAKLVLDINFGKADAPCTFTDIAPVSFPAKPKACVDAEAAAVAAKSSHSTATNTASAESAKVGATNATVAAATKAASKANSAVKKADKAVKKANKAVKKAKSKAKKAKAKKAANKKKKSLTKQKKALSKAKSKVAAAKAQHAAAVGSSAAANTALATATAAVTAAQAAVVKNC